MAVRRLFRVRRRGTTTVEAAFVLPIFFTFLLGLFEICYAQMVSNMLRSACSKGARYASVDGVTNAETIAYMKAYLASAMDASKVTISIKDVSSLDEDGSVPDTTEEVNALPDANLEALDDQALVATVRAELGTLLDLTAPPLLVRVHRFPRAMPQYAVGHLDRVAAIEAGVARLPGLALAGAAYRGIGIPDCVHDGEQAAERVLAGLAPARLR